MKHALIVGAGILMLGLLPATAEAGHRHGKSSFDISIGFGYSSGSYYGGSRYYGSYYRPVYGHYDYYDYCEPVYVAPPPRYCPPPRAYYSAPRHSYFRGRSGYYFR